MVIKKKKINKMISRKEFNKKKYGTMTAMQDADNSPKCFILIAGVIELNSTKFLQKFENKKWGRRRWA